MQQNRPNLSSITVSVAGVQREIPFEWPATAASLATQGDYVVSNAADVQAFLDSVRARRPNPLGPVAVTTYSGGSPFGPSGGFTVSTRHPGRDPGRKSLSSPEEVVGEVPPDRRKGKKPNGWSR